MLGSVAYRVVAQAVLVTLRELIEVTDWVRTMARRPANQQTGDSQFGKAVDERLQLRTRRDSGRSKDRGI